MTIDRSGALSALRNLFFAGTGAASAVLLLVLLVVAGRALGDEAYGRFSFALALATILEVLMDFGLKEVVTRSVARDRSVAPRLVARTYGLKVVLSVAGLLIITTLAVILRQEPDVRLACILLGISAVLRSYLLTARHLLNGLERFGLDSTVLTVDRVMLLALGTTAVVLGYGVVGLSAAFVVARVIAFAIAHLLARSQVGPIGVEMVPGEWREMLRLAAPFGIFIAVLNLYSYIDTIMLGVLTTDAETGLYSAAYRVYEGLVSLASIMGTVAGPRLAREFVTDRDRHASVARVALAASLVAAIPLALGTAVVAPRLMGALFGAEFVPAATVLRILVAGLIVVFPLQVMHAIAISVNGERLLVGAAVAGCIINVALNLVLIPRWGMRGAAVATIVSEGLSLGVIAWRVRRLEFATMSLVPPVPERTR